MSLQLILIDTDDLKAGNGNETLQGIEYLKNRAEVDPARVGIIGHSEGGQVAFMIGARPEAVAFVISLAGVGVNGLEILRLQMRPFFPPCPHLRLKRCKRV